MRFCLGAIAAHALWISTIVITVAPLVSTWNTWYQQKLRAIAALINDQGVDSGGVDARITAIKDLSPTPDWNVAASALAVITSLAGPCLQVLIK
jgi:hypothetical protein